jgi:hypothetical protein
MGTFKDSLKKWFFMNNSSAASTTARVALLGESGEPIGSDTMANLASVLGVDATPLVQNSSITVQRARAYMLIKSYTGVLSIIKTGPTVDSTVVLDFGKESKDVDYTIEVNADQTTTITNKTTGNLTVKRIV